MAKSPPSTDADTREKIFSAVETLTRSSSSRFTLNQIADSIGIHYTAVYHYFKNRDDLELQLLQRYSERRSENLALAQQSQGNAMERLCEFITLEMKEPSTGLLIRSRFTLSEPYREKAIAAYTGFRKNLADLIKQGTKDQSIRDIDPRLTAHAITRTLDRFANHQETLFSNAGLKYEEITIELLEFFKHGILPSGAPLPPTPTNPKRQFPELTLTQTERILRAMTASFNTKGFRGSSIPETAKGLGVSKTSFYKYATSKEELLYLCAQRSLTLISQIRHAARAVSDNPLDCVLQDVFYSRQLLSNNIGTPLSPYLFDSLSEERNRVCWDLYQAYRMDLVDVLEQCVEEGLTRKLNALAVQPMITSCSNIPIRGLSGNDGYMDTVSELILKGLAPD